MPRLLLCVVLILFLVPSKMGAQQRFSLTADSTLMKGPLTLLPQNFYTKHLGFFCRQELQVQKATGLPLYFRLGSKTYVDYLERKPNAAWGSR